MQESNQEQSLSESESEEIEIYADPDVRSMDGPVPTFLKYTYFLLPIWGLLAMYSFWNGSHGWLDRGYWQELQIAANTTFPIENFNLPQTYEDVKASKEPAKTLDTR